MACVAGQVVICVVSDLLEGGALDRVATLLGDGLAAIASESAIIGRPRGYGMMLGFDLVNPATGGLADVSDCHEFLRRCLAHGLLVPADGPRVRLTPPLTLSVSEAEFALETLSTAAK